MEKKERKGGRVMKNGCDKQENEENDLENDRIDLVDTEARP